MLMPPGLRKLALAAHVTASLGWFGAVAAFLALAIVGLNSGDALKIRSAYIAMDVMTQAVIVPLCFASLLTGILQSLGTTWGLLRHYWVVAKLLLTVIATIVLMLHTRPIHFMARAASHAAVLGADLGKMRLQLVADSAAALVVLLVVTGLAVFKPRGMTRYGWRKRKEQRGTSQSLMTDTGQG